MSECYDNYHRWEPLAEFHFDLFNDDEGEIDDEHYIYCLCSRVLTREAVKTYEVEKYGSESDVDIVPEIPTSDVDDHSHVHFSVDTSHKVKYEKDEAASCYCSASHTDNYCSTDEHDLGHINPTHVLQPSDSGADLTYQDYHYDYTHDTIEEDVTKLENYKDYLSENTWEKFWALHGERIIWASWIKKYSDYINPDYLDDNNDVHLNEHNIPQKLETKLVIDENKKDNENSRERKYSYDSKVNPCVKGNEDNVLSEKQEPRNKVTDTKDDTWVLIGRRRSSSEHERIVSPKTLAATDSMTNVTKATLSSYNVTSSHVTSDSTPTDGYSVTSSTSDDQFNDQTRIANIDEIAEQIPSEELDNDQYWQLLWKKHFGEQYALHYAYYIESHDSQNRNIQTEVILDNVVDIKLEELKIKDNECDNSDGHSQELPSVVEIKKNKPKKSKAKETNKVDSEEGNGHKVKAGKSKKGHKHMTSVGVLLQHLLKEQQEKELCEAMDAGDENSKSEQTEAVLTQGEVSTTINGEVQQAQNVVPNNENDDEGNEPPEENYFSLKRSHELDAEEIMSEKIKNTFEIMGFCLDSTKLPKGELIYKKRIGKLRPPRNKKWNTPRKTYFDDDGNPYYDKEYQDETLTQAYNNQSEAVKENITSDYSTVDQEVEREKPDDIMENVEQDQKDISEKINEGDKIKNTSEEQDENYPLQSDIDTTLSDTGGHDVVPAQTVENTNPNKRRKRPKRHYRYDEDVSELPEELREEPNMLKYWKKRHSLFHKFDEGIKLDVESWFSVTPENVAAHIADRCAHDVIFDAFCGAGGNAIQFARTSKKVIAMDIDPKKIELARHNAAVYGVADNIEFIVGDFFELGPTITADFVFLSPPWGGPKYSENFEYDIESMLEPKPASELMRVASEINANIALYLPRNSKTDQIVSLAQNMGSSVEIEQSFLDRRFVAITAYFY